MAHISPPAPAKSRYAVHPGVVMVQKWVESLPEKTDRFTHRIPIDSLADIDDEVKRWLKAAFDLDR